MRVRTVIVLLMTLMGLSVLLVISRSAPARESVVELWPRLADSVLSVAAEDGDHSARLSRETGTAWLVTSGHDANESTRWPADIRLVRQWLREVVDADPRATDDRSESDSDQGIGAEIRWLGALGEERAVRLRLGAQPLGGRRSSTTAQGDVLTIREQAADLLRSESIRSLRTRAVMPGIDADAIRIEWSAGGASAVLRRVGRAWSLTEPVASPASPNEIERLLSGLAGLSFESFSDDGADAIETPAHVIRVDQPGNGRRGWEVVLASDGRVSSRSADGLMQQSGTVSAADLNALDLEPASLIDRVALRLPMSDIDGVRIEGPGDAAVMAKRRGRAWEGDLPIATELLLLITSAEADSVTIQLAAPDQPGPENDTFLADQSDPVTKRFDITLQRFGGIDTVALDLTADAAASQLRLRDGDVVRAYDASRGSARAVLDWLISRDSAEPSDGG